MLADDWHSMDSVMSSFQVLLVIDVTHTGSVLGAVHHKANLVIMSP